MAHYYFQCVNCNHKLSGDEFHYLCPKCEKENRAGMPPKGILWMKYQNQNYPKTTAAQLLQKLSPIEDPHSCPPLKIGNTPLYSFQNIGEEQLDFDLLIKDDSQNPSYSFKDRASALVSAYAKEKGFSTIITASTGNAGSSLACICAAQGQKAIILLPESAPLAKLVQVEMYGAELIKVNGNYDLAFDRSIEMSTEKGYFNRNTAYNPLTIEGKKSVSFEIYDQMDGLIPDAIFVPVGDGVILSGLYKGFEDLLQAGYINRMPQVIAVQADNSSNLIDNLSTKEYNFPIASTIADSISVDIPRNFYMAKYYIETYEGMCLKVSDDDIMEASSQMARYFGLFAEPASATAFAGFCKYRRENKISMNSRILILHTGAGLKDVNSAQNYLAKR